MEDLRHLFTILILLFSLGNTVTAVPLHELESMINALRATGYNLFGNAIITSDINYEILSGNSFTVFAPTDSSLFALDMTASASEYINALHYHVVPRRFSLTDLRTFPAGSALHSLDPTHEVILERRRSLVNEVITVDGVAIVVPDLFYGRDIVVHGLGGIITSRSEIASGRQSPLNTTSDTVSPPQVNLHVAPTPSPQGNLHVAPTPPPQVNLHVAPAPQSTVDFGGSELRPIASPTPEPPIADYGFPPVNSPKLVAPAFADSLDFISSPSFANSPDFTSSAPFADSPDLTSSASLTSSYVTSPNLPEELDYPNLEEDTEALSSSVPYAVRRRHPDLTGFSRLIHSDTNLPGTSLLEIHEQGYGANRGDTQALIGEEEL